jgi:hypothetical protein
MYRKSNHSAITPKKFELPFEGKLSPENRWVTMAELIPWSKKYMYLINKLNISRLFIANYM